MKCKLLLLLCVFGLLSGFSVLAAAAPKPAGSKTGSPPDMPDIIPGAIWPDDRGVHVNAHGGGILYADSRYYWFGEYKSDTTSLALDGVTCYSSPDLVHWKNEGIALPVMPEGSYSDIERGCILERPKVVYNAKTNRYVMWFHLELKGKGYAAARVGVAVSDRVTGPYRFVHSFRPCAGFWPENLTEIQRATSVRPSDFEKEWTPSWIEAVQNGLFTRRDFLGGQMSRDMTVFVDDDGKAYHIYASEENLTLQIAELTDDYQSHTGRYIRIFPSGHNEAPALFKRNGRYFMFTSGCTGWAPNEARLFSAPSIWGPWTQHPNPCAGPGAALTFHSQSTFVLPVAGKKNAFIFMADRWTPEHPSDARYIWLPIRFENDLPVLQWTERWNLNFFDQTESTSVSDEWKLIWSDEFNGSPAAAAPAYPATPETPSATQIPQTPAFLSVPTRPDTACWAYEQGFVRNEEFQWYQPQNAWCENGKLIIEARKETVQNPDYRAGDPNWKQNRRQATYTSACLHTAGKKEFLYGRFEIRARIPVGGGAWPAIWALGRTGEWPSCGEIDLMEYYRIQGIPHILANAAWGSDQPNEAVWNSRKIPYTHLTAKDSLWADAFHVWRMDWNEEAIRLYVDDELLNEIPLSQTVNGTLGKGSNPFKQPHYLLVNLAIGGTNGGEPDPQVFPMRYEIDYVRVYQKKK